MAKKQKLPSELTPNDWDSVVESLRKACENAAEATRLFKDAWKAFGDEFKKEAPPDSGRLR